MEYRSGFYIFLLLLFISGHLIAQPYQADSGSYKWIAAGPQYARPASFQHWWGKNRRKEWTAILRVAIVNLDTIYGGLAPYKPGGGNETKSLKLRTASGKEYALRSINKSRKDVISPYFENTFVANIIKDGVSMSHPYGAFALAYMEEKAGIPHTLPILVYIPQQRALDTFNAKFGNDLYMLEQKPEGDWSESDNMGNFSSYSSTEDVVRNLLRNHHHLANQHAYVRARLFDMLIADWDRHEENWQWGKKKTGDMVTYLPVPKDRDQAFYTHDGVLIDAMIPASGLGFMQNFDYSLKDMDVFNTEEKDIDRFFTNEMDKQDWIREAKALQEALTDEVIQQSVQQLPPEIYHISGKEIVEKLKSRLKQLPHATSAYYDFLAKEVDVVGTKQRELFEVKNENENDLLVTVSRINNEGLKEDTPYFKRIFHSNETREIRLYGMGGGDKFVIDHPGKIKIRIIGDRKEDSLQNLPRRIRFYEGSNKYFQSKSDKMKLSSDTETIRYKYDWFNYKSKGFQPVISYNYEDRLYAGIHYQMKSYKWGRDPFAGKHRIGFNYSISQRAISASYDGIIPNVIGQWNVIADAKYDAIQWTNFFGLGNTSIRAKDDIEYYRMHIRTGILSAGLSREIGRHTIQGKALFRELDIKQDSSSHVGKVFESNSSNTFSPNQYAGVQLTYKYVSLDDSVLPVKGITVRANGMYLRNITEPDFFQQYDARIQSYLPLTKKFSLMLRAGGATIVGPASILNNALPIQHAVIGGPDNLRGYAFDRFWGRTSFYNNNEIRFITNLRSYILNAKIGVFGFFDDGRVWISNESSNTMHTSYGGGILLSPFHFLSCTLTYGISSESKLVQFKINTLF